jgi:dsRNA-specific ribonuclease
LKDKADLLEAFLGALYIDKDLQYCEVFAQVGDISSLNGQDKALKKR